MPSDKMFRPYFVHVARPSTPPDVMCNSKKKIEPLYSLWVLLVGEGSPLELMTPSIVLELKQSILHAKDGAIPFIIQLRKLCHSWLQVSLVGQDRCFKQRARCYCNPIAVSRVAIIITTVKNTVVHYSEQQQFEDYH